jgi:hypothetical protein
LNGTYKTLKLREALETARVISIISIPTNYFSGLVQACASLYKLVQARKAVKPQVQKARSKILQVKSENLSQSEGTSN